MVRSRLFSVAVLGACVGVMGLPVLAQPLVNQTTITVQSVRDKSHPSKDGSEASKADFRDMTGGMTGEVLNGQPADPNAWPATLISRPSGCTATLVGPRILVTAAHCTANNAQVSFWIGNRSRKGTCVHHPDYSADSAKWAETSADYAICLVDKADAVAGVPFEVIGAGPLVKANDLVTLLGFGCNGTTIDSDGYGMLRFAAAGIESVPNPPTQYFIADWSKGGFGHAKGGVVCPGDSGGAVYRVTNGGVRQIVALNSRTGVLADGKTLNGKSYLSSVLSQSGITQSPMTFFQSWSTAETGGICGMGLETGVDVAGCRK